MSSDDRDMLIEVHTSLKFMQRDIAEIKSQMKEERKDLGRVKAKVYAVSSINGVTTLVNLIVHLIAKLPAVHFSA